MTRTANFPLITASDAASVLRPLRALGLIDDNEPLVSVTRAGEGNMNCVLRARCSDGRTLIVKQSRPWVEKYPEIDAPVDRALAELRFMRKVAAHEAVATRMPRLLGALPDEYLLVFEDVGSVNDFRDQYACDDWTIFPLETLTSWLAKLHAIDIPSDELDAFANLSLRRLNHAHIFEIPFSEPPAMDLDRVCPGLRAATLGIRTNPALRAAAKRWGALYLQSKSDLRLLHGDFYPGAWLHATEGVYIIDAEFCFVGPPEFDLAILAAHCILAGADETILESVCRFYAAASAGQVLEIQLIQAWTGIEIFRRILGIAQLPLDNSPASLQRKLDTAMRLVHSAGIPIWDGMDRNCAIRLS